MLCLTAEGCPSGEVPVDTDSRTDSVSTPAAAADRPSTSSSSTSRIPRLTSSLRRRLPVLAGLRHDRKQSCTTATVQATTPPSCKVRPRCFLVFDSWGRRTQGGGPAWYWIGLDFSRRGLSPPPLLPHIHSLASDHFDLKK